MTAPVDVLADPASVNAALAQLFDELQAALPPDCRNFGPNMHPRVIKALAQCDPAAMDAAEAYVIARDCARVESVSDLRADILLAALARVGGAK